MTADRRRVATISRSATTKGPDRATWLRVADVARLLGMSANTVRRWTDAGRIPAHRSPGGHRRYLLDEIVALAPDVELVPTVAAAPAADAFGPARPPAPSTALESAAEPAPDGATLARLTTVLADAPHDVPSRAASELLRLTGAARCEVLTMNHDHFDVHVSLDTGGEDASREGLRLPFAEWRTPADDHADGPVALRRGTASRAEAALLRQRGCHALLWAPLVVRGTSLGALEVSDTRDRDLSAHLPLVDAVARFVGHALDVQATTTALERARAHDARAHRPLAGGRPRRRPPHLRPDRRGARDDRGQRRLRGHLAGQGRTAPGARQHQPHRRRGAVCRQRHGPRQVPDERARLRRRASPSSSVRCATSGSPPRRSGSTRCGGTRAH